MHEHLQRHLKVPLSQLCLQTLEITKGQLPGQNHTLTTKRGSLGNPRCAGDRHLGRAVHAEVRHQPLGQAAKPHVLDDHRIHIRLVCSDQQLSCRLQFIAEHQHVEGEEALYAPLMQPLHHLGQHIQSEIFSPLTGVECINAEIDRIGTACYGCLHRSPVAGRRQQFRDVQRSRLENRLAGSNNRSASALPW